MTDLALNWTDDAGPDIALGLSDVATDDGLTTATAVALFSDARATADDGLPQGADPRGHWGDAFTDTPIGSLLWLVRREKITPDLAGRIQERAQAALQRSIVDTGQAIAASVEVTRTARDTLTMSVTIDVPATWMSASATEQRLTLFGLDVALIIRADTVLRATLAQFEGI